MIKIRRITMDDPLYPQECALRESVLLRPIGFDMAKLAEAFPGFEERFEHFVAVFDHPAGPRVIGCALLLPSLDDQGDRGGPGMTIDGKVGKLMQMAVDPQRQGEGIGTQLVVAMERRAFGELGLAALFCHARDVAYGFYSALGWAYDSETFEEAGIPHRRMIVLNTRSDDELV